MSKMFLEVIGFSPEEVRALMSPPPYGGLAFSAPPFFGGSRNCRALEEEPAPRTLVLVGMTDRFDAGRGLAAEIRELAVETPAAGGTRARAPSPDEVRELTARLSVSRHPQAEEFLRRLRSLPGG